MLEVAVRGRDVQRISFQSLRHALYGPNLTNNVRLSGMSLTRFVVAIGVLPNNKTELLRQDIGQGHYISDLPGNNPAVAGYVERSLIRTMALSGKSSPIQPSSCLHLKFALVMPGWKKIGCYADPDNSNVLKDTYTRGLTNLTPDLCLSSCAAAGYKYAGIEWSEECACGNTITPGSARLSDNQCPMPCAGLTFGATGAGFCGGPRRMTVYQSTGRPITSGTSVATATARGTSMPSAASSSSDVAAPATTTHASNDDGYELVCTRIKKLA